MRYFRNLFRAFLALDSRIERTLEKIMAQIDDLSAVIATIGDDVTALKTKFDDLETTLQNLQNSTPPEVDLTPALDQLNAIKANLESIGQSAQTVPVDETPPTAPVDDTPDQPETPAAR